MVSKCFGQCHVQQPVQMSGNWFGIFTHSHSLTLFMPLFIPQYHKTVEAVYAVENSAETLLDLLQRYREKAGCKVTDKGGSIFTKTCFLMAILLQDPRWAQVSGMPKMHIFFQMYFIDGWCPSTKSTKIVIGSVNICT